MAHDGTTDDERMIARTRRRILSGGPASTEALARALGVDAASARRYAVLAGAVGSGEDPTVWSAPEDRWRDDPLARASDEANACESDCHNPP